MSEENKNNQQPEQDLSEILRVRREKLKALQDAGKNPFTETRFDVTHHAQEIKDNFDALEGQAVSVGGRLMSKRGMGKVSFCDLQDRSGRIQRIGVGHRLHAHGVVAAQGGAAHIDAHCLAAAIVKETVVSWFCIHISLEKGLG